MSDSCIASWALVTVTVAATLGVESCVRHHETHVVVRHIVEASVELDVERITRLKADGSRKDVAPVGQNDAQENDGENAPVHDHDAAAPGGVQEHPLLALRLRAKPARKERQEKPAEDAGDGVWNVHAGDSSRNRRNGQ